MSGIDIIRDLGDRVESACKLDKDSKFLPSDQLDEFVTPRTVNDVLKAAKVHDSGDLVQFVLEHAKKLFLIIIIMTEEPEKLSQLANLKLSNITDKSLPVNLNHDRIYGRHTWSSAEVDPTREVDATTNADLVGQWTRNECKLFGEYQWYFLAPTFGKDVFRFYFHRKRVLPYLYAEPRPASSGFFGEVSRVQIHKAHLHNASSYTDRHTDWISIAIKKAKHGEELAQYFDKEASNLLKLQEYKSPHLIKPIAAYQIDNQDRCLVFPWADGGNLLDYYRNHENQRLEIKSLHWLLGQLKGLCSAVEELHGENARHGDLKPENILWFKDDNHGVLQIADLGLAAFHEKEADTQNRKGLKTITPSGTSRYEPPEMDEKRNTDDPRSRQYDIWSMGCVLLELLIWLIYGYGSVETFTGATTHFWECHDKAGEKRYSVHPYVKACMREMLNFLPNDSAYKDLLYIVQGRLLVVSVSEKYESLSDYREIAKALHEDITRVVNRSVENSTYLQSITSEYPADTIRRQQNRNVVYQEDGGLVVPRREGVPVSSPTSGTSRHTPNENGEGLPNVVVRAPTEELNSSSLNTSASVNTVHQQHASTFNDEWDSISDKKFATEFFNSVGWDKLKPKKPTVNPSLCKNCSAINSIEDFNGEYNVETLKLMSASCDLCNLLFASLDDVGIRPPRFITLIQDGATVRVKDGPKVLSIYVEPDANILEGTSYGLPRLLQSASNDQFNLLKSWVKVCDSDPDHKECYRKNEDVSIMPTRLIEIGNPIKLIDSTAISPSPYVALSHCWGPVEMDTKFCTFQRNIDQLRKSINFDSLPPLFKDAVRVVQGLGLKYIWVDSLCIVQDNIQDWEIEASRMEQVFSGAYFTIAASSASSSNEGFLLPRRPRPCIQLCTQDVWQIYVCPNIDNFHQDVELGVLNRRGWVLQERVLSRRSIYFSSNQIYWECGIGVHCETLTRLQNSKAAFLGDANFPESALEYYRDGRQVLVQDLYERYSGLAFTKPSDRSVAILGLQKRLSRAFQTQAAFGLLAVYFARGLLWQRRDVKIMKRIAWPRGRIVPSWSWFSKEGPIKYMNLEFKKVDWANEEFISPFTNQTAIGSKKLADAQRDIDLTAIRGRARKLRLTKLEKLVRIVFDADEEFDVENLRCVVVGRDKPDSTDEPKQHVLVVHPLQGSDKEIFERVGVASLRPAHVGDDESWITIC